MDITNKIAMNDYSQVWIPKELIAEVGNHIKNSKLGYKTNPEFIKAAIREKIEREKEVQKNVDRPINTGDSEARV